MPMWKDRPTKEKVFRALLHIPIGILNAVISLSFVPIASILLFVGFMIYEISEDWRIKDGAYLDVFGWLIGYSSIFIIHILWTLLN